MGRSRLDDPTVRGLVRHAGGAGGGIGESCRVIGPDGLSAPADGDIAVVHAERPQGAGDPPTPILHPGIWIVQWQPATHPGLIPAGLVTSLPRGQTSSASLSR